MVWIIILFNVLTIGGAYYYDYDFLIEYHYWYIFVSFASILMAFYYYNIIPRDNVYVTAIVFFFWGLTFAFLVFSSDPIVAAQIMVDVHIQVKLFIKHIIDTFFR